MKNLVTVVSVLKVLKKRYTVNLFCCEKNDTNRLVTFTETTYLFEGSCPCFSMGCCSDVQLLDTFD